MLVTRLHKKLDEIADILLDFPVEKNSEIGVLGGISGIALFHFYYSRFKNDEKHQEKGIEIIHEILDRIQKGYNYPTFCDGIAGALWVLEVLKQEQFIDVEEEIITDDVDTYLYEKMKDFIADNDFDFLHGAIGVGYYFLKRYENVQDSLLKSRYEIYLLELLNVISKSAIKTKNEVKWKSDIISGSFQKEGYNLGLAHGIPSIILFLSKLANYPTFNEECFKLLEPSCNYLISCKHTNKSLTSSFPNWITDNEEPSFNSRLAWCYGDLGIGIALLQTAKAINNEVVYSEAVSILSRSTQRKNAIEAGIKDPGLCHGSYGVMNLYLEVFKMSNEYIFKDSTDLWIESSLDMIGFDTKNKDFASIETNLLNGIPGIGLAIMSYLDNEYNRWKEAFLIV